jgi:hypothetical protein
VNIPADFYKQNYDLAKNKGNEAVSGFPFLQESKPVSENVFESLLNRTWRPTLTVTGQTGFP